MNKYIEWDLEKFKAGWPAEWQGKPAKFVAHVPEAMEKYRVVFLQGGRMWSVDDGGLAATERVHLLARELDPHPDNRDGLYRDQIGDGWRIKGHGEPPKEGDEVWWDGEKPEWRQRTKSGALDSRLTYRTRDPLPEPMFKVGDRVRHAKGDKGQVVRVNPGDADSAVRVKWDNGTVGTFTMDGRWSPSVAPCITKLTTQVVPLGPEDIVLGKTVVRTREGQPEILVIGRDEAGIGDAPMRLSWETLRTRYEISFDHGATWQKAEKEVEDPA
jgi:hypothetical protein